MAAVNEREPSPESGAEIMISRPTRPSELRIVMRFCNASTTRIESPRYPCIAVMPANSPGPAPRRPNFRTRLPRGPKTQISRSPKFVATTSPAVLIVIDVMPLKTHGDNSDVMTALTSFNAQRGEPRVVDRRDCSILRSCEKGESQRGGNAQVCLHGANLLLL